MPIPRHSLPCQLESESEALSYPEHSDCCDKNVIVVRSERVYINQNASQCPAGKRLKNQVEWKIFITDQNTPGVLQNRRVAGARSSDSAHGKVPPAALRVP